MDISRSEIVECYLVFTKTKMQHWIFRFLDSEIQHVYVMQRKHDKWVIINPLRSHIEVDMVSVDEYTHPRLYEPTGVIVQIKSIINRDAIIYGFNVLSCVSIVKSLLGIKKRFILTPYQLYKYITEAGYGLRKNK